MEQEDLVDNEGVSDHADNSPVDTAAAAPVAAPAAPATLRDALASAYDEHSTDKPAPKPEVTPVAEPTVAKEGEQQVLTAPVERPIPERLKAKFGEKWAILPPEVKTAFHDYESHVGGIVNKYGKAAKAWEEVQQITAPYEAMVKSEGGTLHTAMSSLFETARILRQGSPEQKIGLVQAIVKQFNVPMPGAPAPTGEATPQPTPAGLSPELLNRFNQLEQRVLTNDAREVYTVRAKVDSDLAAFTSDPANVYIHEPGYLDTMAALIRAEKAETLEEAYQQAAWLHEGPRKLEIAKITANRNQPRVQQAQQARRAGISVNGNAPGVVRRDPSKMTLRDTLAAAFDGDFEPND
jgi:hypothetical protein